MHRTNRTWHITRQALVVPLSSLRGCTQARPGEPISIMFTLFLSTIGSLAFGYLPTLQKEEKRTGHSSAGDGEFSSRWRMLGYTTRPPSLPISRLCQVPLRESGGSLDSNLHCNPTYRRTQPSRATLRKPFPFLFILLLLLSATITTLTPPPSLKRGTSL
ncbi:hypothetical protein B0T22DRAFT_453254 [Podospora appendiculata]|uniref:Uncharacterized protein n=1 Tax=Podospora appendiculata TaxID=314037 RepID=A0AAE1CHG9_9PEZI|nr:hypothetical protein B0T22DRAFT_453254 [Podospora appendiculata]